MNKLILRNSLSKNEADVGISLFREAYNIVSTTNDITGRANDIQEKKIEKVIIKHKLLIISSKLDQDIK